MTVKEAIGKAVDSKNLTEDESFSVATEMMEGKATDAQIAALLVSLRLKGETTEEITGFAKAMRIKSTRVPCESENLVDTCGTGGDRSGTFNVSTLSALVAAGAGCRVAKHGNRSVSSQCGSADLFMELGVQVEIPVDQVSRCIDEAGIGFLFAPLLHKAMKYAIGPRREIGVRTIFNILGPLTNPAGAKRQLLGVYDNSLTEPLANVLMKLGSEHVLVVHGEDGLDEISLTGRTRVCELKDGKLKKYYLEPEEFGLRRRMSEEMQGGDPAVNAKIAINILSGSEGAPRDLVLLNAGSVIYVGGKVTTILEGIEMARESIDSGMALRKLEALKKLTNHES